MKLKANVEIECPYCSRSFDMQTPVNDGVQCPKCKNHIDISINVEFGVITIDEKIKEKVKFALAIIPMAVVIVAILIGFLASITGHIGF